MFSANSGASESSGAWVSAYAKNRLGNRLVHLTGGDLDQSTARLHIRMRCTEHLCTIATLQGLERTGTARCVG